MVAMGAIGPAHGVGPMIRYYKGMKYNISYTHAETFPERSTKKKDFEDDASVKMCYISSSKQYLLCQMLR